jgi:hypothetical protein
MDDLDKRKTEALVVVSLSTATLIVCFSFALALLEGRHVGVLFVIGLVEVCRRDLLSR